MSTFSDRKHIRRRVDAALGRIPCDLVFRDVTYLDVFAGRWHSGDVAVLDGMVVALDPGLKAKRTVDGRGKTLVPGFIDAHVHVESSMLTPENFQRAVLPRGTTTAICDPHELANVLGVEGIRYFLSAAERLCLDLRVMLSSCVPATDYETNGGGHIRAAALVPLASHPRALGLAEMMNVPGVLHGDEEVLEKIEAFAGRPIDGHCPLVTGQALSAYAAAGIGSCHESTRLDEAREKLRKGIAVWIREGSVAKDLHALVPLLDAASSAAIGFCTDDRNPLDIATEGHIDFLVRGAIRAGVATEIAYRAASWSVARHYGLFRQGAIAPGYVADLVLLDDAKSCSVRETFKSGLPVGEIDLALPSGGEENSMNTVRIEVPPAESLEGPKGRVHVIGVEAGKILTGRTVENHDAPGVARLSVLERYGHRSPPANGYARGFGSRFHGAIGSSVGHDSHNLIVVGHKTADISVAFRCLAEMGGGYCVVRDGQVVAKLPLPFGGLMSRETAPVIRDALSGMRGACRDVGCELPEPFLQLAFLSLPVIPSLKLTDKGLVDVEKFQLISVSAA